MQTTTLFYLACPEGWHDSKHGTCYKFVTTRTYWKNARRACDQLEGHLAIIDTVSKAEDFATIRRLTGMLQIFDIFSGICLCPI